MEKPETQVARLKLELERLHAIIRGLANHHMMNGVFGLCACQWHERARMVLKEKRHLK